MTNRLEVPKQAVVAFRRDAMALAPPLLHRVETLVIKDAAGFARADSLLTDIIETRGEGRAKIAPILDPLEEAFREINKSKRAAQALHREFDEPLEEGERRVRTLMSAYKTEEARQIAAAQFEKQKEEDRLRKLAEAKELAAAKARTAPMRARLAEESQKLEDKAAEAAAMPVAAPVRVAGSGTRTIKKWRLKDFHKVLAGVVSGSIPEEALTINTRYIDQLFKDAPETVAGWSGFETYDEVQIVRR